MQHSIRRRAILGGIAGTLAAPALIGPAWAQTALPAAAAGGEGSGLSIAQRMAHYVAETNYDALDATTIETAKAHLIDAIGCGIAAYGEEMVRECREAALDMQGGASTVIGTSKKTTPELATFANGAAIRYYDFNDVYSGKEPGHPSDNLTPCLAVAEALGRSGRDFLLAMVLAYEIDCRLLDAAELTRRGWDHPIDSLPASALGVGKLMGLSPDQLEQAVNIAINGHIAMNQTRVQVMSDWKGLADADAARNGLFAATLAKHGITGPSPIFEGNAGFFKLISGPFEIDTSQFGGKGGQFKINSCDVKPYPAQGGTLTAIPAAVEIAKQVGDLGRIATVVLDTTDFTYRSAGRDREKWAPATKETADHSLPFVVARAMMDGGISFDSFSTEAIHDPKALALMAKMTVNPAPDLTAMMPRKLPNRLTVTLTDGSKITKQVETIPGLAGMPMARADFEKKFAANVNKAWSDAEQRRVLDTIWNLDRLDKLDHLFEVLVVPA